MQGSSIYRIHLKATVSIPPLHVSFGALLTIVKYWKQLKWAILQTFKNKSHFVVIFQLLSPVQLFVTPWTAACQAPLSFTISWSLFKLMSIIKSVMLSNHLILCCSLLLLPSIFPSIRLFFSESALHIRWPKYWSFSIGIPMKYWSGLISFRIDWFDLLAVQGTLKSIFRH